MIIFSTNVENSPKTPVLKVMKVKIFLSTSLAYRKTDHNDESRRSDRYEQMVLTTNKILPRFTPINAPYYIRRI